MYMLFLLREEGNCIALLSARSLELSNGGVDLLSVLVVTNAGRGQTRTTALARTHTNNVSVNGARNTVDHLDVQLRKRVLCKRAKHTQ